MSTIEILDINETHGLILTAVMPGYYAPKYEKIPEGMQPVRELCGIGEYVKQCHAICRGHVIGLTVMPDRSAPRDGWRRA